jgi:hypothetical protein
MSCYIDHMSDPLLTDEVWRQLDPDAGRLSPVERRRVTIAIGVVCTLAIAALLVRLSGVIVPNIAIGTTAFSGVDTGPRTFFQTLNVHNGGWRAEEVVAVARPPRGMRITAVDGLPISIPADSEAHVTVHYVVDDCSAVTPGPVAVTLRLHRPWGTASATVTPGPWMHPVTDDAQASAMFDGLAYAACHG